MIVGLTKIMLAGWVMSAAPLVSERVYGWTREPPHPHPAPRLLCRLSPGDRGESAYPFNCSLVRRFLIQGDAGLLPDAGDAVALGFDECRELGGRFGVRRCAVPAHGLARILRRERSQNFLVRTLGDRLGVPAGTAMPHHCTIS